MLSKIELLGVGVTNATPERILEYVEDSIEKKGKPYYIVTPNPEILVFAARHAQFAKILNNAKLALIDGVGVQWAGRFLKKGALTRFPGVDFMEILCKRSVRKPITMGFLGGRQNVALKTAECLMERYPGLQVSFIGEEWDDARGPVSLHPRPTSSVTSLPAGARRGSPALATPSIDVLFVAFGFPKQEEWMAEYVGKLPVKVMVGVGGAFDYISGNVPRAPAIFRRIGVEWLFRLIRQPWRIKRQLALLQFVYLVFREQIFGVDKN